MTTTKIQTHPKLGKATYIKEPFATAYGATYLLATYIIIAYVGLG